MNNFDCQAFSLFETVAGSGIKTIAILWYAQEWRIRPLQIHNNFQNPLVIINKHLIFSSGSKDSVCCYSINISNCRCKRKFSECQHMQILQYAQARLFCHLANKQNFCKRFTFLKKHQISSRSLKESFSGNSVKLSDCRAFSPFETLPGCRAFSRHSVCLKLSFLEVKTKNLNINNHRASGLCLTQLDSISLSQKVDLHSLLDLLVPPWSVKYFAIYLFTRSYM